MWESIVASAVAGVVAALAFAFVVHCWRRCQGCKEAAAICDMIDGHRGYIFEATDLDNIAGLPGHVPVADVRAWLYNQMLKEVGVSLDTLSPHLPLKWKRELLAALNWYHASEPGKTVRLVRDPQRQAWRFPTDSELPPGTWPVTTMSPEQAKEKFGKLEALKWLKLPKAESSD